MKEDYLHLYMECEVQWKFDLKSKFWLIGVDGDNVRLRTKSGASIFPVEKADITLVLRPLRSMTDEDWREVEMATSVIPDAYGYHGVRDNFLTTKLQHRFHWTIVNEALIQLRKRSIDVDGLIRAGLAIDATTLKV